MTQRTIAVLGANSFSGQDFVDLLLEDPNHRVLGVSRSPERDDLHLRYQLRDELERYAYQRLDLNQDMDALLGLLDAEQPEWIVNFAAQSEVAPSWNHPEHWFQTNTVALARLVNHLRKQSYLKRYLHISSPEVYGDCRGVVREDAPLNPSTPYAASKAAADLLLETYRRQFQFPLLSVRATNVYGARQQLFKIIPRTCIYQRMGKRLPLHGGGTAIKSYIHIRDVSRGELAILERGEIGQLYHLSPDQGVSIRDLVSRVAALHGKTLEEVADDAAERPGQDAAYVIDSSLARETLQWRPEISLDEGLRETADWVEAYWPRIQQCALDYQHRP